MTRQDVQTANVSASGTLSASVETTHATKVHVFVDNNAGGAPGTYDFDVEVDYDGAGSTMQLDNQSGIQTRHFKYDSVPNEISVTLTNTTSTAGDYRIRVVAVGE